ncbi:MAG: hypothetical protein HZC48_03170 [Nitrospirae bacterium]|nr:hypothetical protein [Nitrospirota bacterium]
MKSRVLITILSILTFLMSSAVVHAGGATRVAEAIWANGNIYDTILTPATFVAPPLQSTDIIYSFMLSGLEGQRSVAESAPGDQDYNGGRWNVQMVVFTPQGIAVHDPDGDGIVNFELTTAEMVLEHEALGHLTISAANFYFECPLLPRRGNR